MTWFGSTYNDDGLNYCVNDDTRGNPEDGCADWGQSTTTNRQYSTMFGTVRIQNGCNFRNCTANSSAGAIEFADKCYITAATISDTTIDGCKAKLDASAILIHNGAVKKLDTVRLTVQNCDFMKDSSGGYYADSSAYGGTIRSYGSATAVLTMTDCVIQNNKSWRYGGGLY